MSDLSAAAEAVGAPEAMVQRSAEARAQADGTSVEEVLAAWAGGGTAAGAAPPTEEAPEAPTEETAETPAEEAPEEAPAEQPDAAPSEAPAPAAAEPAAAAIAPRAAPPAPETVTPDEAANYPVVITVPTAGIKERTNYAVPTWLVALFMLVPLFGLLGLAGGAETVCNEATELQMDRQTGNLVNCDGTAFEGREAAGGGADFIAIGEGIYPECASCHGPNGEGGVGPALAPVTGTFGSCTDHIAWVAAGTSGFQAQGLGTYGDSGKPVGGGGNMPGFEGTLDAEQMASVVAFERVRFGGENPEAALVACGLAEEETTEGGEEGAEEAEGGDGATVTTAGSGG